MDKKILLVADDDEMNRRIIARFLKNDYDIIEAEDGEETLKKLHSQKVDGLLLDIIMPKIDGLEVLKQLRSEEKFDTLGVLVATSTKEKTERTALSLGADDVVSKPYDPVVIKKRMENLIAMKTVSKQRKQLLNQDIEKYIKDYKDAISSEVDDNLDEMMKCLDMLTTNLDNKELVEKLVAKIKTDADAMRNSLHDLEKEVLL